MLQSGGLSICMEIKGEGERMAVWKLAGTVQVSDCFADARKVTDIETAHVSS